VGLLLQFRQAARQAFCSDLLLHRQKALHGSFLGAAQTDPSPNWPSTAPAKTAPIRRNDSRRGTETANDFENSS
jgi:hypothetical protein